MSDAKPTVLCLVNGVLREQLFHPATVARIETVASIRWLSDDASSRNPDTWRVERKDVSVVLGTWGMPNFDNILLDTLPGLRLIAHGAGTVKGFVTPEVFARGIRVTHGAVVIAAAVGEWCLMATLSGLRLAMSFHESMRAGAWKSSHEGHGNELAGKRVGLIAMSQTARAFLRLLAPFGCEIGVYDPYLSDEAASSLGVRKVSAIDDLCAWADVLSNHVPTTPETERLVGAPQLARLRSGALLVNSARAGAIDQDALLAELRSGRIRAALDVYPREPLAPDDPFRTLPNVFLTPHIAGASWEARSRMGEVMADEITRFVRGEPLRHEILAERLGTMA